MTDEEYLKSFNDHLGKTNSAIAAATYGLQSGMQEKAVLTMLILSGFPENKAKTIIRWAILKIKLEK